MEVIRIVYWLYSLDKGPFIASIVLLGRSFISLFWWWEFGVSRDSNLCASQFVHLHSHQCKFKSHQEAFIQQTIRCTLLIHVIAAQSERSSPLPKGFDDGTRSLHFTVAGGLQCRSPAIDTPPTPTHTTAVRSPAPTSTPLLKSVLLGSCWQLRWRDSACNKQSNIAQALGSVLRNRTLSERLTNIDVLGTLVGYIRMQSMFDCIQHSTDMYVAPPTPLNGKWK